jgi:hypothetical protein
MALLTSPRCRAGIAAITLFLGGGANLRAQTVTVPIEANVKAVFLFNFAKYVTWPPVNVGERSPAEVRVCVTANDAFFALLKSAVQGEDIDGKPLLPIALDGLDEAKTCQILYVGDSRTADAKAWFDAVKGSQVLTVADGPLNDDTVIAFTRDDNRIRFDINRAAASRRSLNISSKLLRLARQVRDR